MHIVYNEITGEILCVSYFEGSLVTKEMIDSLTLVDGLPLKHSEIHIYDPEKITALIDQYKQKTETSKAYFVNGRIEIRETEPTE